MPFQIDEEKMATLKMMDIGNPPVKSFGYEAFPKCIYLHPKDKTKEHKTKIVKDQKELDAALKQGWKLKPHIPDPPPAPDADDYETFTK